MRKRTGELPLIECGFDRKDPKQRDILWRIAPQVEFQRWGAGPPVTERGVVYACTIGPRGGHYINILSMCGAEVTRNEKSIHYLTVH